MREIKFRAWDKRENKMEYNILSSGLKNLLQHRLENPDWFKVMQYTGLKDKNGKDIYDGDIDERRTVVVCGNEYGQVGIRHRNGGVVFMEIWDVSEKEIIGNIYENSELL